MQQSINGLRLAYDVQGESGPWIIFSHSLGCTRSMWRDQLEALSVDYRVLSYDLRGHGESEATSMSCNLDELASDVLKLMDALGIGSAGFVGISIGGMIGQTLAINSPRRVDSLVLANTSPATPPGSKVAWFQRLEKARAEGVQSLAAPSIERWFPEAFRQSNPLLISDLIAQFGRTTVAGYVGCCEAIMKLNTLDRLDQISCPTLIIGGTKDPGSPAPVLEMLNTQIKGAELFVIDGAGHLSNIDHSDAFTDRVRDFFARTLRRSQTVDLRMPHVPYSEGNRESE